MNVDYETLLSLLKPEVILAVYEGLMAEHGVSEFSLARDRVDL